MLGERARVTSADLLAKGCLHYMNPRTCTDRHRALGIGLLLVSMGGVFAFVRGAPAPTRSANRADSGRERPRTPLGAGKVNIAYKLLNHGCQS